MGYILQILSQARPLLLEAIGTLLLVVINTSAILTLNLNGQGTSAAVILVNILAMAIPYGWLIYIWGQRNSGYFNPAVTVWLWLTGQRNLALACTLILAQLAGAIVGSILVALLYGSMAVDIGLGSVHPVTSMGAWAALVAELFGVICLLMAFRAEQFAQNAPAKKATMIALGLMIGQLLSVGVSGGALNPARALAPQLVAADTRGWWLYWVGPILAAIVVWMVGKWLVRPAHQPKPYPTVEYQPESLQAMASQAADTLRQEVEPDPPAQPKPEEDDQQPEVDIPKPTPVIPTFQPEEVAPVQTSPKQPVDKPRRQPMPKPAEIKFVDFDKPAEPLESDEE